MWTDPDVRRYLGGPVSGAALSTREEACVGHFGAFGVVRSTDRAVLGLVSVEPRSRWQGRTEVSYQLLPAHWGRGYGREAVGAVVAWALGEADFEPAGVVAVTQEANHRSRRLLESVGMSLIDHVVEWDARQVVYALDRASTQADLPAVRSGTAGRLTSRFDPDVRIGHGRIVALENHHSDQGDDRRDDEEDAEGGV
ncbi:GNAT family N-acetyltransferase [Streptomyces sp. NBC_01341]|uniref:GNAT family N-acetyltransferase n=1 Tax=Streptomyces sp. NBC_01341 TaxID=2903831 RepID=UPI003FA3CE58